MFKATRLWLAYAMVLLIWSGTPLAIQWSAAEAGLSFAVFSRMTLAAVGGAVLCGVLRTTLPCNRGALFTYLVMGGGFYLAMMGVYWASTRVNSGLMSVLFGLTPIASSLLAGIFLREPLSGPLSFASMLLAVFGLAVIFADTSLLQRPGFILGAGVALLAMLVNAGTLIWLKQHKDAPAPLATTVGSILVSLPLFALTWWLLDGQAPTSLSSRAQLAILYLALPASLLAFALYYYILRHLRAQQVALILVLTPILALFWGHWLNQEQLPAQTWIGSLIVLCALGSYIRSARASGR